ELPGLCAATGPAPLDPLESTLGLSVHAHVGQLGASGRREPKSHPSLECEHGRQHGEHADERPGAPHPLTTIIGASGATSVASPARTTTSTTSAASLYAHGISSAMPPSDRARTVTPRSASTPTRFTPRPAFFACARLISRPAPWHVVPKLCSIAPAAPSRRKEYRPMSPGMMTGCPSRRSDAGSAGCPRAKARVAPLPRTQTRRARPPTARPPRFPPLS